MAGRHRASRRSGRWLAGAAHGGAALLVAASLGSGVAIVAAMREDPAETPAPWRATRSTVPARPLTPPTPPPASSAPATTTAPAMTTAPATTTAPPTTTTAPARRPAPETPPRTRTPTPPAVRPAAGTCRAVGWGGVKGHVARAGYSLVARFGLNPVGIIGVGERALSTSDHPRGLALDFFADRRLGDELAAYVLAHRDELAVTYVIWRQRIDIGAGWRPMANRGGPTANHYDHVHVSFRAAGSGAQLAC